MSKVFEARFHGECPACDSEIVPGEDVCYDDDDVLIHANCNPVDLDAPAPAPRGIHSVADITRRPRTTPASVCPVCSIDHAGECY